MPIREAAYTDLCTTCRNPASERCPRCERPACGEHLVGDARVCPTCEANRPTCSDCAAKTDELCLRCERPLCEAHHKGGAARCRRCENGFEQLVAGKSVDAPDDPLEHRFLMSLPFWAGGVLLFFSDPWIALGSWFTGIGVFAFWPGAKAKNRLRRRRLRRAFLQERKQKLLKG